jgi:hypothetical protein
MTELPPNTGYPIGTILALDSEESQWRRIRVCGMFNNGPDAGGWDVVVQPVEWGMDGDNSPRKVDPSALADLGYVIETAAEETSSEWVTA